MPSNREPIAFIIVADLRTGSTLLSATLNRHPDIRCLGELFHPQDWPDNQIEGINRYAHTGRALVDYALSPNGKKAVGFRAMVFLPLSDFPNWADAWQALADRQDLQVIFLERQDCLAQYVSYLIASRTGKFHPSPEDPVLEPGNRPRITIDPDAFRFWSDERRRLRHLRKKQLQGKNAFHLEYSKLVGSWQESMHAVQKFIGIDPVDLPPAKQKQETRELSEVIDNFEELKRIFKQ